MEYDMTGRYSGTFFILKSLFLHYFLLSSPFSYVALATGVVTLVGLGLSWILPHRSRSFMLTIGVLALLPLLIGITGTIILSHNAGDIAKLEEKVDIKPSAEKYYDLQYGSSRTLLLMFPAAIGAVGSVSSVLLIGFIRRKDHSKRR